MARVWLSWAVALAFGAGAVLGGGAAGSELAERLGSSEPGKRRSAVRALAKVGDRTSWRLVLGALSDEMPEVADQAQLALAGIDDEVILKGLLGKQGLQAKAVETRRRAAEVLGRVKLEVAGGDVAKGLSDRDEEVRRRVLWSIERLAEREVLGGELDRRLLPVLRRKWKGDRSAEVRAACLMAIDAVDSEVARELARKGLTDRREEVRCAALLVAARHADLTEELELQLEGDPSSRVRSLLIESYATIGTAEAARALVRVLDAEPRLRLRWSALAALRRISGMKYRMNIAPWRAWAESLPRSWRASGAPKPEVQSGGSRVFGGMPLLSDRVAFLFDLSGSLWNKREDGTTRKEYADRQLALALGSLEPGSKFNIIPYTKRPFPWSDELESANERNLERAYKDFENCRETGQGNFYSAALLAMSDPEVDTIMVLTDGAPTGGEIWSLELMIPMLLSHSRFKRVRFDSILVDAPKGLQHYWRELAEKSGGQVIVVEADSR